VIQDDYFALSAVDFAYGVSFNNAEINYPKALGTGVKLHQQ
jgi:hypothetical protein